MVDSRRCANTSTQTLATRLTPADSDSDQHTPQARAKLQSRGMIRAAALTVFVDELASPWPPCTPARDLPTVTVLFVGHS